MRWFRTGLTTLLLAGATTVSLLADSPMATSAIKPRGLSPGDTIMLVAPAGKLDLERVDRAAGRLRALGFRVLLPEGLMQVRGYLAGDDQRRAEELMRAFTDPEVDAIFPGTGGFGTTRMLDRLDYELIRKNPKPLIGYSDITGLHSALQTEANLVTFHSPVAMWGLGSEEGLAALSAKAFWRNLLVSENQGEEGFAYTIPEESPLRALRLGAGKGPLCGGNLSLLATLTGTPYQLDTEGKVLFLEDVGEKPYRIDRMLSQLRLSGQLDRCAAVLLGQFTKCEAEEGASSLSLDEVFADYFAEAPYPVIANFPAGHARNNVTLPLGVPARVDADRLEVRVLENPVRTR